LIYFLQPVTGGPVKIGNASDVDVRRAQLEFQYGCPLVVLGTMKGDHKKEREIHRRFAHLRFGRTEQFRPAADLMTFIGRPLLVGANPDAVELMESRGANAVVIRGSVEWREWLKELAELDRSSMVEVIDRALVDYARKIGCKKGAPKR
jgi:hypothetical protein